MYGPEVLGFWSGLDAQNCTSTHQHLVAGRKYRVVREFKDFDGDVHPIGEVWTFMGSSFLPYDDGLSLFVSPDDKCEWHIRMQWRPEQQGEIIDSLPGYIEAIQ